MPPSTSSLVLASASPRRVELLSLFGIPFETIPAVGEELAKGEGRELVMAIAQGKCDEVFFKAQDRYVLAADTLVCVEGAALGKPKSAADAAAMLAQLSGRWHEVHTGCCLRGPNGYHELRAETTKVKFTPLSQDMIARYVHTGEPMDKAGAYAIQGMGGLFIERIEGSPSNVIGLPLSLVRQMLENVGFSPLVAEI